MSTAIEQQNVKFPIKIIHWSKEYADIADQFQTPILLQDLNGPCALIALINTLVLDYDWKSSKHAQDKTSLPQTQAKKLERVQQLKQCLLRKANSTGDITLPQILAELGDLILFYNQFGPPRYEIDQLLDKLPLLHTGLNVNPNLISGQFEGQDIGSILFELFDLKFRHGWTVDQVGSDLTGYSGTSANDTDCYAKLVEIMYQLQNFDLIQDYLFSSDESPEVVANRRVIRKWLDSNKTQLTKNGLERLNLTLHDDEFIVFFRNNHFSTLFKRADGEFYLLITDSSFQNKSNQIVWQSLTSVSGKDDLFYSGTFFPILDIDQDIPDDTYVPDNDLALVRQLQEEEDAKIAQTMQSKFNSRAKPSQSSEPTEQATAVNGTTVKSKKRSLILRKRKESKELVDGANQEADAKSDKCHIV